jgi:hypothetical protein
MVNLLARDVESVFTMRNRCVGAILELVRQVLVLRKKSLSEVTFHLFGACELQFPLEETNHEGTEHSERKRHVSAAYFIRRSRGRKDVSG